MKRRILSFIVAGTMIFSMTACTGKEKIGGNDVLLTVDELKADVSEALSKIDSVDIDLNGDVTAKLKAKTKKAGISMENEYVYKFDLDSDAQINVKEPGASMKFNFEASSKKDEDVKTDMKLYNGDYEGGFYVTAENDKYDFYFNVGKGWYKSSAKEDEITSELLPELSEYFDMEVLTEFIGMGDTSEFSPDSLPVISDKTVEACGRECYELIVKNGRELIGGNPQFQPYYDMVEEFGCCNSLYIDVETNLPLKVVFDADMKITDNSQGTEQVLDIEECTFEITMEYNNVEPIVVPDDVKRLALDYSATE